MKVRELDFDEWRRDFEILYQMHFLEILAPRGYNLDIDDDFYRNLEKEGALKIIGIFNDEKIPIGYSLSIISPDLHDDSALVAFTAALYLHPDERHGMAGVRLLRVTEAGLAAAAPGARWRIGIAIDVERDTGILLERVGLSAFERVYTKTLAAGESEDG